jgi:hypothetical protein
VMQSAMASQKHKTQRPIRSCLLCRTRRVKCDQVCSESSIQATDPCLRIKIRKVHPACSTCIKVGRRCQYKYFRDDAKPSGETEDRATVSPSREGSTSSSNLERQNVDMGHLHYSSSGRSHYIGPSFWGITNKDVRLNPHAYYTLS